METPENPITEKAKQLSDIIAELDQLTGKIWETNPELGRWWDWTIFELSKCERDLLQIIEELE